MFCFNIHFATPPHWGSWHSFFQFQCLCRADLLFSFSGLDTSERFFIAKCCHQEWAAHACSRFAHVLLTLAHALLTVCSRFRVLLSPYEVPFGSLRGCAHGLLTVCSWFAHGLLTVCSRFAHGLLTVCSRCSRFAHALLTLWGIMCVSWWRNPEANHATFLLFRTMCT